MPVEPEPFDHQLVEMPRQIIREEEAAELRLHEIAEGLGAGEELVAMRAGDALDAFLRQHAVELAAGAAIAIGDEDAVILPARRLDLGAHAGGDLLRPVMPAGRQAGDREVAQALLLGHGQHLARERAAGDDEGGGMRCHGSGCLTGSHLEPWRLGRAGRRRFRSEPL